MTSIRSNTVLLTAIAGFTVLPHAVQADVVYDNGLAAEGVGTTFESDVNGLNAGGFSVDSDTTVTGVNWIGGYFNGGSPFDVPVADNFTISIFADVAGSPSVGTGPMASFAVGNDVNRVDTGVTTFDPSPAFQIDLYSYSAEISFEAVAGVSYWMGIQANTADEDANWGWGGAFGLGGDRAITFDGGDNWIVAPLRLSFELTSVPAPTTAALFGLGGLTASRRRRS